MPKIHKIDRRSVNLDPARLAVMLDDPRVRRGRPLLAHSGEKPPNRKRVPDLGIEASAIPTRGIALSGGGAKGSFQIGVLKHLYEERRVRPQVIVGTSVGSVNGVKLTEGETASSATEGHTSGFAGLELSWLDIKGPNDMYVTKPTVKKLLALADRGDGLADELKAALGLAWTHIGLPAAGVLTDLGVTAEEAIELIEKFLYIDGLVSLAPVTAKLDDPKYLDAELVRRSRIDFRTVWVGMLSGEAYCVDQQRRLYRLSDPTAPIGSVSDLTAAIHASAAQPLFMQSPIVEGEIGNKPFKEKGFDGGVREIVGVKCAAQLGAKEIFAILCQPIDPGLASIFELEANDLLGIQGVALPKGTKYFEATMRRYKGIFALAERGLNLALDEVLENDLAAAGDATIHVIRPYVEVHDGMTLHPAFIQVNMSHSWMCAFDAFHDEAKNPISFLVGGNRLITENRALKERLRIMRPHTIGDASNIDSAIAECNARIGQGLALRAAIDPASLPAGAATWDD